MKDLSSRRWIGLVFISLAVALIIVDSTIVNVAVPAIVEDLGISSTQVQWVQEAYTLVFASMLLLFGSLADRSPSAAAAGSAGTSAVSTNVTSVTPSTRSALTTARTAM